MAEVLVYFKLFFGLFADVATVMQGAFRDHWKVEKRRSHEVLNSGSGQRATHVHKHGYLSESYMNRNHDNSNNNSSSSGFILVRGRGDLAIAYLLSALLSYKRVYDVYQRDDCEGNCASTGLCWFWGNVSGGQGGIGTEQLVLV